MKAFLIDSYRGSLHAAEVAEPVLGARDVLVDIRASSVNQLDLKIIEGEFRQIVPYKPPFVLGHDLAGVVTRVGSSVTAFSVGDEVYSKVRNHRIGTFAERIAVDEADLALKPTSLGFEEAASLPLVALTAWQALVEIGQVGPGAKVLIHSGAGGVGSIAIQLAKHLGATVATTASAQTADWVRSLGADLVVDYRKEDFAQVLHGHDFVLDSLGGQNLERSLGVLRPGGTAVGIAGPPTPAFAAAMGLNPIMRLAIAGLSAKIRRRAKKLGVRYEFLFMRSSGQQLAEIAGLVDAGALRPVVGETFPFDRTAEAAAALAKGGVRGKVVISRA